MPIQLWLYAERWHALQNVGILEQSQISLEGWSIVVQRG